MSKFTAQFDALRSAVDAEVDALTAKVDGLEDQVAEQAARILELEALLDQKPADPGPVNPGPVDPPVLERPSKTNTGLLGVKVTPTTEKPASHPNTTYTGKLFSGKQTINLKAGQTLIFDHCKFEVTSEWNVRCDANEGKIIFYNCEFSGPKSAFIWGKNFEVYDSYCHDSQADGFKPTQNVVIKGNYIHLLGNAEGSHADGVQVIGKTRNVRVEGNFFDQMNDKKCNRNLMASEDFEGVLWLNNWNSGHGDYAIQMYDSKNPGSNRVEGNIFYDNTKPGDTNAYKPKHVQSGTVWKNNTRNGKEV